MSVAIEPVSEQVSVEANFDCGSPIRGKKTIPAEYQHDPDLWYALQASLQAPNTQINTDLNVFNKSFTSRTASTSK
jgi:hypothetical protein